MTNQTDRIALRKMEPRDLETLLTFINIEGWNYDISEMKRIHEISPGTSVVACAGDELIGGITAVTSGGREVLAHVIIKDGWRNKGAGTMMIGRVMEEAEREKISFVEAYSVKRAIPFYRRHGFHCVEEIHTYSRIMGPEYRLDARGDSRIRTLEASDLPQILSLDRAATGFDRGRIIRHLFNEFPGKSKGFFIGGHLTGFIQGRTNPVMSDIGPWTMLDPNPDDMRALLRSLLAEMPAGNLTLLGIPGKNSDEARLLVAEGMELAPIQLRMVRPKEAAEPFKPGFLALSAFEFG